jgi:nitroimidazol reductase NimA-like FMN-containing flavoprotein (pyridoxamine 5'-phosphate oxidase superfamily)
MNPTNELQTLDFKECLPLLRAQAFGRLVFTEQALPAIRLVNYSLYNGQIALRLGRSPWVPRLDRTVVAFEVDDVDKDSHTGWSVVVIGKARLVLDIDELVTLSDPTTRSWVPGPRDQVLCVDMEQVTGRRLRLVDR